MPDPIIDLPQPPADDNPVVKEVTVVVGKIIKSAKVRWVIYAVLAILLLALAVLGIIDTDDALSWIEIVGFVLGAGGLGLAAANKPQPVVVPTPVADAVLDGTRVGK